MSMYFRLLEAEFAVPDREAAGDEREAVCVRDRVGERSAGVGVGG